MRHSIVVTTGSVILLTLSILAGLIFPVGANVAKSVLLSDPFPQTGILDNFDRANGGLGSNWSGDLSGFAISNSQMIETGGGSLYWGTTPFGSDQEAYVTLSQINTSANEINLLLKAQGNTGWTSGRIEISYQPTNQRIQVVTYTAEQAWTQRGPDIPVQFVNGDRLGAFVTATGQVQVYKNDQLLATVDVTAWPYFALDGYIGVDTWSAAGTMMENFGGGTLGTVPTAVFTTTATATFTITSSPASTLTPFPLVYPQTGILDNYDRANGGLGSNWSGDVSGYAISNQQMVANGGGYVYWGATPFGSDQEAYVTLNQINTSATEIDLLLKAQTNSGWASGMLEVWYQPSNQRIQVVTYATEQNWTQRGADIPVQFVNGDRLGAVATAAGQVQVYKNDQLLAVVDITAWPYYASTGYIGLYTWDAAGMMMDNFGGGTIGTSPTATSTTTPTTTSTYSFTPTPTKTPKNFKTNTPTATSTYTKTPTRTVTITLTPTYAFTHTTTPTLTFTPTATTFATPSFAWSAESEQLAAFFGWSVASADLNGDDYFDLVVGAPYYAFKGAIFVYYGSATGLGSAPSLVIEGTSIEDRFGWSVGSAGDVNGDGFGDLIVSAIGFSQPEQSEGCAYVYYGSANGLSSMPAWKTEGNQDHSAYGYVVGSAGDVNGDGVSDVFIGAPTFGERNQGKVYVYQGSQPSGLSASPDWVWEGDKALASFGLSVASAGDINGDHFSDLIVGAPNYSTDLTGEGKAFVFTGTSTGLATTASWSVEGNHEYAHFGEAVSTAGDLNGDGFDDILVGAPYYSDNGENVGGVSAYLSSSNGLATTPVWTSFSGQAGEYFGVSLSPAGDVNHDGYDDFLVGANRYSNGEDSEGKTILYYGAASGVNAFCIWAVEGEQNFANLGYAVGAAGDFNGDLTDDFVITAPQMDHDHIDEGKVYLYFGVP